MVLSVCQTISTYTKNARCFFSPIIQTILCILYTYCILCTWYTCTERWRWLRSKHVDVHRIIRLCQCANGMKLRRCLVNFHTRLNGVLLFKTVWMYCLFSTGLFAFGCVAIRANIGRASVSICRPVVRPSTIWQRTVACSLDRITAPFHSTHCRRTAIVWRWCVTFCHIRRESLAFAMQDTPDGFCRVDVINCSRSIARKRDDVSVDIRSRRSALLCSILFDIQIYNQIQFIHRSLRFTIVCVVTCYQLLSMTHIVFCSTICWRQTYVDFRHLHMLNDNASALRISVYRFFHFTNSQTYFLNQEINNPIIQIWFTSAICICGRCKWSNNNASTGAKWRCNCDNVQGTYR